MKKAMSAKNIWEMTPRSARTAAGWLLGHMPPGFALGSAFRRNLEFVKAADRWSGERARAYQLEAVRRIVQLAWEQTDYYRRQFRAIGFHPSDLRSLNDLRHLPTIDKDTLRHHLEEMCARSVRRASVDYVSTGGTSGTPLHFFIGRERSAIEYAYLVTAWERVGYRPGMPMAVFRGRVVPPDRRGLRHEYDALLRHHYYSNFHMTEENMARYCDHIRTIGPCFLHVYPSAVSALSRFIRRSETKPPENIRGIIAESENVYVDQRRIAEEVFNCPYFSCYGHSEKLVAAAECEHSTDYHAWPTYGYLELLDERGEPITTPGQRGAIVGTGFINTVVPFVRYRTGDFATYVGDRCDACGREHTIIRDIRGHRDQEVLIAADGSEISWTALNVHDNTFARVRQFQFSQKTPGQATLRLVPADRFGEKDMTRIQRTIGRRLDGQLSLTVELTDEIPLTACGKARYVDQRLSEVVDAGVME